MKIDNTIDFFFFINPILKKNNCKKKKSEKKISHVTILSFFKRKIPLYPSLMIIKPSKNKLPPTPIHIYMFFWKGKKINTLPSKSQ